MENIFHSYCQMAEDKEVSKGGNFSIDSIFSQLDRDRISKGIERKMHVKITVKR